MIDTGGLPPQRWESWNPVNGCTKVSEGCRHCYAERFAERWRGVPGHHYEQRFDLQLRPERLELPLRWRQPRRIFVDSMGDLFHGRIPDEYVRQVFAVMERAPQHVFHVLTKRSERLLDLAPSLPWPPHVWMGVTVERAESPARSPGPRGRTGCAARATAASPPASPSPSRAGAVAASETVGACWTAASGTRARRWSHPGRPPEARRRKAHSSSERRPFPAEGPAGASSASVTRPARAPSRDRRRPLSG